MFTFEKNVFLVLYFENEMCTNTTNDAFYFISYNDSSFVGTHLFNFVM